MALLTASLVLKALSLISAGIFLGIGFYLSKKITNKVDDALFLLSDKSVTEFARS